MLGQIPLNPWWLYCLKVIRSLSSIYWALVCARQGAKFQEYTENQAQERDMTPAKTNKNTKNKTGGKCSRIIGLTSVSQGNHRASCAKGPSPIPLSVTRIWNTLYIVLFLHVSTFSPFGHWILTKEKFLRKSKGNTSWLLAGTSMWNHMIMERAWVLDVPLNCSS